MLLCSVEPESQMIDSISGVGTHRTTVRDPERKKELSKTEKKKWYRNKHYFALGTKKKVYI